MARALRERDKDEVQNMANHVMENRWDDWVPQDRVRKFTPENKELAAQLHNQMKALQRKPTKQPKRGANGSDFSSARDSEERMGSVAATGRGGRGVRPHKDYDLEHVSRNVSFRYPSIVWLWLLREKSNACTCKLLSAGLELQPSLDILSCSRSPQYW